MSSTTIGLIVLSILFIISVAIALIFDRED